MLPETLQYTNGDTIAQSISIVDLGNVDIPNGRDLDTFGFTSEFPARYDPGYVVISKSDLKKPIDYKKLFEAIKNRKGAVQLIVPVLGINKTMFIQSFNPGFAGFEGDIPFDISFRELRTIKPKKLTPGGTAPPKGKKQAADRPKASTQTKPKTYTVVAGDTLVKIAKKLGIKDWRNDLYLPNKKPKGPISNPDKLNAGWKLKV